MVEGWWTYPKEFKKGMHTAPTFSIYRLSIRLEKKFGLKISMHTSGYSRSADTCNNMSIIALEIQAGDSYRIRVSGEYSKKILEKILEIFGEFTIDGNLYDNSSGWAEYPKQIIEKYFLRIRKIIESVDCSTEKGARLCQT